MNLLKDFDQAIVKTTGETNGYCLGDRTFDSYLSNEVWAAFLSQMSVEHRRQYGDGSGGELEEKNGRPPKMASFASSSRMIYRLSNNIPGFIFEKQLSTVIGGIANLDGYLERAHDLIFIEAKCREPYSHTAIQTIKQNYRPLYAYLREKMPRVFSCVMENVPDSRDMRVAFFCKGDSVAYFDIKQIICHMLGVANKMLTSRSDKAVLFLYLLYNPEELPLPPESKQEIMRIYADTSKAACNYRFEEMFGHIVDFLIREKHISEEQEKVDKIKSSFRFVLCNQNEFIAYIAD